MTSHDKDLLERAADFLEAEQKPLADSVREIAFKETTGECARCSEPTGKIHHRLFGPFSGMHITIEVVCNEDRLLCDSCVRHELDKLPAKLLKS